jgi:hypothetical protein
MFFGLNDVAFLAAAAAPAVPTDPNFANVSLLLHGDGANGSTTIIDSSPSPKTVTAVGNAQISTAQSKFGGASIAFDGTGDYLTIPTQTLSGNFTVEAWVYLNNTSDTMLFSGVSVNTQIRVNNPTGTLSVVSTSFPDLFILNPTSASFTSLTWNHVALARSGTDTRLFLNGLQVGPTQTAFTQEFQIATFGAFRNTNTFQGREANGYFDEIRITQAARYTASFTPPTAPFPDAGPAQ